MAHPIAVLAYALFLWWFGTGVILFLNHLPPRSFRNSLTGAFLVLLGSLWAGALAARTPSVGAAWLGFACGLGAWSFQEMSFFMGALTGPRRLDHAAPSGPRRFGQAVMACLYHELAIAVVGLVLFAVSWHTPNPVAAQTYAVLWLMRISAKLNIYLGVRNLNEAFLPRRLRYLKAYMRQRPLNPLLPLSLAGGVYAMVVFAQAAASGHGVGFVGPAFIAILLGLGVIEHVFLVLPLPFAALWTGFAPRCPVASEAGMQQVPGLKRVGPLGGPGAAPIIITASRAIERS